MDYRELEEHMVCIGAPVYDSTGEVTGAISISGLYRPDEDYECQGELVKQKAEEVSKLLGFVYWQNSLVGYKLDYEVAIMNCNRIYELMLI